MHPPRQAGKGAFARDRQINLDRGVHEVDVTDRHDHGRVIVETDARPPESFGLVSARDRQLAHCHELVVDAMRQSVTPRTSSSSITSSTPTTLPMTSVMLSVSSMSSTSPRTTIVPPREPITRKSAYMLVAASARSASRTRSSMSSVNDTSPDSWSESNGSSLPVDPKPAAISMPCGSSKLGITGGSIGGT